MKNQRFAWTVTPQTETVFCTVITKVKAEITFYVSAICSEINVRRKFTGFVTYRYIYCVFSYLFLPKFLVRCLVD